MPNIYEQKIENTEGSGNQKSAKYGWNNLKPVDGFKEIPYNGRTANRYEHSMLKLVHFVLKSI